MSTQREQLLAAVAAALSGVSIGAGVYRSRVAAFARDELPAVVVRPANETVEHVGVGVTLRSLEVDIEVHTRGTVPDQLADAVILAAHAALMADQTLGGHCARIVEQETGWEFHDADQAAAAITLKYHLIYFTPTADLTRQA